ncbi:hypothetical protein KC842_00775 [Candidatus Nomurabacteria bacterium]|nr:hypothetical protein [Candidatus Nomurabacteria bacterium]USN95016.1 MAG: hypothetical protein H6791_01125 [Candidatus Nomurabacteria bacterium]
MTADKKLLNITRATLGFVFLWAFFDKLFGLGFATTREKAWLSGGSPTTGFLTHGVKGPFADFFGSLAGVSFVDWVFMLGLLFVGLTLFLGIMVRVGSVVGILMLMLMYFALIPPDNNPFVDDHLVDSLFLLYLVLIDAGQYSHLGRKLRSKRVIGPRSILR